MNLKKQGGEKVEKSKKAGDEKRFKGGNDSSFPFGEFEKMAEMMRSSCPGGMAECCSMMMKMTGQDGKGEKSSSPREAKESP
jgi:hypothetical protein